MYDIIRGNSPLVQCSKNCENCKYLSGRTDNKGYPFGYECMRYGDSVFKEQFKGVKVFKTREDYL